MQLFKFLGQLICFRVLTWFFQKSVCKFEILAWYFEAHNKVLNFVLGQACSYEELILYCRDDHQNLKLLLIDLNHRGPMHLIGLVERTILVFKSSKPDVRCKVMAFRVLDFYIGLLEHFKKSKSLRSWEDFDKKLKFEVIFFFIDLLIQIIPNIFRNKIGCNETITTYFGCLVKVSYKIWGPKIHSLTCEMQNPI